MLPVKLLDHGSLQLLGVYPHPHEIELRHPLLTAQELLVVQVARNSFESAGSPESDVALLRRLVNDLHMSPFEFVSFHWVMECPLFVAAHFLRYRTARFAQFSQRYADPRKKNLGLNAYLPYELRGQSKNNKQASSDEVIHDPDLLAEIDNHNRAAQALYGRLLGTGMARELARTVLPEGTYTRLVMQIDARHMFYLLRERLAPDAQYETRVYAQALYENVFVRFMPILAESLAHLV